MSSRALRKAQREKEEQERIQALDADSVEEEDEAPIARPAKKSAFAMLDELDDGDDHDTDEDQTGGVALTPEPVAQHTPSSTSKKSKKKKKKAKPDSKSTTKTADDRADDMDEIDAALRELSMDKRSDQLGSTASGVDPVYDEACHLMSVDRNYLHAQNEMRRLFGRTAVEQDDENTDEAHAVGGNRRQQRHMQQQGLAQALRGQRGQGRSGIASLGLRRNIFIQGKEEWPAATGGGLSMEIVNKATNGTVEYRYVHNRAYQGVQKEFNTCVASMDPNRLVVLLQHNPYHISTLLQVSEIAKNERDHTTSGDLLERALFSMGRAVHSTFAKTLSEGKARMDFRHPENREFWLASWRYMQNLSMRGTWRTVYEWARLLLALSPEEDPYSLWLTLDQYALRSKQDLDYINLSRNALFKHVHEGMPNVLVSQGLAECRSGNKSKGQQTLFSAVSQYPWFIARLMHELDIDAPPAVWGKEARTDKERLYADLYAVRAKDIWNTPENTALLLEIASAVPPEARISPPDTEEISLKEARHAILSDKPELIALVPKKYTSQYTSVSDPLPPTDSIDSYAATVERSSNLGSVADYREMMELSDFFRNLLPGLMRRGTDGEAPAAGEDNAELETLQGMLHGDLSEEEIRRRAGRIRDLLNRDYEAALGQLDDQYDRQSEEDYQAHVEDASDHED